MNVSSILTVWMLRAVIFAQKKAISSSNYLIPKKSASALPILLEKKGECTAQNKEQTYLAQPIRHETVSRILRSSSNKPEQLMVKKET